MDENERLRHALLEDWRLLAACREHVRDVGLLVRIHARRREIEDLLVPGKPRRETDEHYDWP